MQRCPKSVERHLQPIRPLKDICFPDFNNNNNNNNNALVIGTDNIDIISPKTIIKGNRNVSRAALTTRERTIAGPNNDFGQFSSHQATATPKQISTEHTQISDLLTSFWRMETYSTISASNGNLLKLQRRQQLQWTQ